MTGMETAVVGALTALAACGVVGMIALAVTTVIFAVAHVPGAALGEGKADCVRTRMSTHLIQSSYHKVLGRVPPLISAMKHPNCPQTVKSGA